MLTFSGTSYLALDRHPMALQLAQEGLRRYGLHYGGSRRSPLAPDVYQLAEERLAQWAGAPAALLFSSGTSAGQLLAAYLRAAGGAMHYSPSVHPALRAGGTTIDHQNWDSWHRASETGGRVLLTDAVDALRVRQCPLPPSTAHSTNTLVIDDSHWIGVGGYQGRGSWQAARAFWPGRLLVCASLGKALALPAGVVLGQREDIEAIKALPQFGGASPPAPAFVYVLANYLDLVAEQQAVLRQQLAYFNHATAGWAALQALPNYPVIAVERHQWADDLQAHDIHISSFHYPGPDDPRYTRIVIRSDHTKAHLEALVGALERLQ